MHISFTRESIYAKRALAIVEASVRSVRLSRSAIVSIRCKLKIMKFLGPTIAA